MIVVFQHAEDAFMDDSCACCGRISMTSLQTVSMVCIWGSVMAVQGPPPRALPVSPFTKVVEGALTPLREVGIRVPNYLDDWPILAQSREQLCDHRDVVLRHLSQLGLRVNWEKSKLFPVQRIYFLSMELDSVSIVILMWTGLCYHVISHIKRTR